MNSVAIELGLSTLYFWKRKCCLQISYRVEFKTWQMRGEEVKKIFLKRRGNVPKSGGSGISNAGNRRTLKKKMK